MGVMHDADDLLMAARERRDKRRFMVRDDVLVTKLDELVERERAEHPGRTVTREGKARELLYRALQTRPTRRRTGRPT